MEPVEWDPEVLFQRKQRSVILILLCSTAPELAGDLCNNRSENETLGLWSSSFPNVPFCHHWFTAAHLDSCPFSYKPVPSH